MNALITTYNLAASEKNGSEDACAAELWRDAAMAVLADGVGNAKYAREAATRAVASVLANLKSRPKSWSVARALEEFTRLVNRMLYQESLSRCGRPELVCTIAAVVVEDGQLQGLNVGDSRLYLFHEGRLRQLSKDHTETEAEFRHVLSRAVGLNADITLHTFQVPVVAGDSILLCSDGLSNVLPAEQIESLIKSRVSARTLVAAARELASAENLDDISAVILALNEIGDASRAALEVPGVLRAGQVFDGYELVRPLNPTERAWIARQSGRDLVMKFAPERARDDDAVYDQFAREIWSVTRFDAAFFIHAFVPPASGTFCYCMEYLPAPTLKTVLEKGPLPAADVVALANFLLDAAQFFAGNDLVHGDLKPENILVLQAANDGGRHGNGHSDGAGNARFKLIDFGSVTGIFSLTTRAGTPSFLAPERFRESPISELTEIFAIGVTLFLALTGRYPYGEIEPFQTPVFHSPARLGKLNPRIPPWLEAVVLRAVAVAPASRYQTYSEMKFDLANPKQVRPWFDKDTPLVERDPLRFYKIGFFLLLLISVVLLCLLLNRH